MTSTFRRIIGVRQCAYVLLLGGITVSTAQARTLSELMAAIDSTSPALAEARYSLAQVRSEYTSSRALPNPILFGENQNLEDNGAREREQTVGIRQPLGFLWSQPFKTAARRWSYESARATFEEERRQIVASVVVNIARIKALESQAVVLDTVLQRAQHVRDIMKARLLQGDISDYQARRIQAELIELQSRRLALYQNLSDETQLFVESSGMPTDVLQDVTMPAVIDPGFTDTNEAVAYALAHRGQLQARSMTLKSAHKALTASTLNLLPEFSLGVAQKSADSHFSGRLLQAEIEIPLFDQRRSARHLARTNVNRARRLNEAEQRIVEQQVRSAFRQWRLAQDARNISSEYGQGDGQLELNRAVRLFLAGELNALEFVDALRTNLDAIQAHLELEIGALRANLELRRASGLKMLD